MSTEKQSMPLVIRFSLIIGFLIMLLIMFSSVVSVRHTYKEFVTSQTVVLQQAGFTHVYVNPITDGRTMSYATVVAAPNCKITLHWARDTDTSPGRWQYTGLADTGTVYVVSYNNKLLTPAAMLVKAGACNH